MRAFTICYFFSTFFLTTFNANCQPCGPNVRVFDQQMITPSGEILLLNTWLGGDLMMVGISKSISLNYVLISKTGELKKDTTINLDWPDYYYDIMSCNATYWKRHPIDGHYRSDVAETGEQCPTYMLYSTHENALIGYFLKGDWKYAYDIQIDPQGNSSWEVHKLDSLQKFVTAEDSLRGYLWEMPDLDELQNYSEGFIDDNSKIPFWEKNLRKIHGSMESADLPYYVKDDYGNYEFKGLKLCKVFKIERIQPSEMVYSKDSDKQDRWQVKGKRWQIPLEGYLIQMYNQPLVSMNKKRLYITVFNDDKVSCPGYGRDLYPILYCIDLKKGRIVWEYSFMN